MIGKWRRIVLHGRDFIDCKVNSYLQNDKIKNLKDQDSVMIPEILWIFLTSWALIGINSKME